MHAKLPTPRGSGVSLAPPDQARRPPTPPTVGRYLYPTTNGAQDAKRPRPAETERGRVTRGSGSGRTVERPPMARYKRVNQQHQATDSLSRWQPENVPPSTSTADAL